MSIAPFSPGPTPVRRRARHGREARRTRLALMAAIVGIAAALVAYGVSPGVRHAVGHAEHSVNHTVTNIFDHDHPGRDDRKAGRVKERREHSRAVSAKNHRVGSSSAPRGISVPNR